jgi:hypothetical protein
LVDAKREPAAEFFVPRGAFDSKSSVAAVANAIHNAPLISFEKPVGFLAEVHLYFSPTTAAFLGNGGLNASNSPLQWEGFLKKYKIPFKVADSISQLEKIRSGVLILPSTVALSQRERQAIVDFRARGGSVLATWLCGVRDEKGLWTGFGFMERALDVKVVGDTANEKDDNFFMPHGDSPVTNSLPAGLRVWLERAKQWHPLRLSASFASAQLMDWSRTFTADKPTAAMAFDERRLGESASSRSVVIGYPERLWLTADPEHLDAVAYNALTWALRLPSAYVAAWPAPFSSALLLAIDASEVPAATDMVLARQLSEIGAKATIYSLGDNAQKSAKNLTILQTQGHELAYLGDKFVGFKDQSKTEQSRRMDRMQMRMKEAGIKVRENAGFHAPIESYDKNTEALLIERGVDHYIAFMDASDARLPFLVNAPSVDSDSAPATVVMPRTQRGPEDATEEGDVEEGLKSFLDELALSEKMAGLSVIRIPTQGLLSTEQLSIVVDELKLRRARVWMAGASQIADWWRERSRVKVQLVGKADIAELRVEITGTSLLSVPVSVWINLPSLGHQVKVKPMKLDGVQSSQIKVVPVDQWRAELILADLKPGKHAWQVRFEQPLSSQN